MIYKKHPKDDVLTMNGFERIGGNRYTRLFDWGDIQIYKMSSGYTVITNDNATDDKLTTGYENVTDDEAFMAAVFADVYKEFGHVIEVPKPMHPEETLVEPEPEVMLIPDDVDDEQKIVFAAPESEDNDGFEIVNVIDEIEEEEHKPVALSDSEDDGYEPQLIEFHAPDVDAVDRVNMNLAIDVENREFQPLNAYPNFPFGDKNSKFMDDNANLSGPAEKVNVELLNDVRDKDGKYVVEKEWSAEPEPEPEPPVTRPKLKFPKMPKGWGTTIAVVVIGLIAFVMFRKSKIKNNF